MNVDVFVADLAVTAPIEERLWSLLDESEQSRALRLLRPDLRRRFTVAHGVTRMVLGSCLGMAPEQVVFGAGPHGKPFVAGPAGEGVEFNLSHSGERALVAVSEAGPVGVDVEQVRPLTDVDAVAQRILSPAELARYEQAGDRNLFVLTAWAAKEAAVKRTGEGIARSLTTVDTTGCVPVAVGAGYLGAVSAGGAGWTVTTHGFALEG
jgi:4'-phosphopantetheinyl transferase